MTKMNCDVAREEMLVADLHELRGEGDTDLAMHVRSCAECRRRAEIILGEYDTLRASLAGLEPRTATAQVTPIRKARRYLWIPLPLAAAAVLALLLVRGQNDELPNIDALTRMMFQETPVVSPAAGQQAMVIEKNNMTIVWLYKGDRL